MKNITRALAGLPLVLSGCGGGGSSGNPATNPTLVDFTDYKGTWANDSSQTYTTASGTVTSSGQSEGLISSDERIAFVTSDYKAVFHEPGDSVAHYFSALAYVDAVDVSINQSGSTLNVEYHNYSRGINGGFSLSQSSDYSNTVTLADLAGIWTTDMSSDFYLTAHGAWSLNVNSDGTFTGSSGLSCQITAGNFAAIDNTANEFTVTMTVSNCSNYNGSHTGIAYMSSNSVPQDELVIITNNGLNGAGRALIIKPVR